MTKPLTETHYSEIVTGTSSKTTYFQLVMTRICETCWRIRMPLGWGDPTETYCRCCETCGRSYDHD